MVDLNHAVTLGIMHLVGEDRRTSGFPDGLLQFNGQVMTVKNVVTEDECARLVADEIRADKECLGNAFGRRLRSVAEV